MTCIATAQIRDVLGDGGVLKRRLVAGQGEFPIDCPLNDTLVTVHLRARNQGQEGNPEAVSAAWAYDSQTAGDGAPLVVDTGAPLLRAQFSFVTLPFGCSCGLATEAR